MTTKPNSLNRTPRSGEFERSIEQAELDAKAAEMRAQGMTYRQIGAAMGVEHTTARDRVLRAIAAVPVDAVNELRATSVQQLDMLIVRAMTILVAKHPMVSHGRVIPGVVDVGPNLAALRELRLLNESKRQLFGLNAPAQVRVHVEDRMIAEIEALAAQLGLATDPISNT